MLKQRGLGVVLLFVVGIALGFLAAYRWYARTAPAPKSAPEVIVALDATPVPIGSRQLFPIFAHRKGHTFELQLRVTAWGDAATNKSPEPESTFDIVVHEPGGTKRYLEKHGKLARSTPGVRTTDIVPDAQTTPPMAASVELYVLLVYEAPPGSSETLEVEVAPVTGRDVTRASAEVRVYELDDDALSSPP